MKRQVLILLAALAHSGCASYVETVRVDPVSLKADGDGIRGVIFYEPRLVKLRYEFTQLIDKEKGFLGSAEDGSCQKATQKEEIVTLPDYSKPRAVLHKPSWFSTSEFGVTLTNGMLTSLTSKATPQLPELLEQVAALKEVGILGAGITPACNAGPVISSMTPVAF